MKIACILFLQVCLFLSCYAQKQEQNQWSTKVLIMPVGVSPDSLPDHSSQGAKLEAKYCSRCHGIPSPANHSSSDWVPVYRRMLLIMERSNSMGGMMGGGMMGMMHRTEVPGPEEQKELLSYLQKHALISVNMEDLPESNSQEAALYDKACNRCHSLPSPSQHIASQWPAVVTRMRQHMVQFHISNITDEQAKAIITYLKHHAALESNK